MSVGMIYLRKVAGRVSIDPSPKNKSRQFSLTA